uniref:Uncharacterized protein n=1 Tax=Arundo donax TaxID=35708 RepID=A0A0A9HS80_ARUDO
MKLWLSFSRRFRSAKMWSWFWEAGREVITGAAFAGSTATMAS